MTRIGKGKVQIGIGIGTEGAGEFIERIGHIGCENDNKTEDKDPTCFVSAHAAVRRRHIPAQTGQKMAKQGIKQRSRADHVKQRLGRKAQSQYIDAGRIIIEEHISPKYEKHRKKQRKSQAGLPIVRLF